MAPDRGRRAGKRSAAPSFGNGRNRQAERPSNRSDLGKIHVAAAWGCGREEWLTALRYLVRRGAAGSRRLACVPALTGLLLLVLCLATAAAAAGREILPLAEVKAGMKGTGFTVIQGTRIEPFDVDILGVVPGAGPTGDLILVRVGGPLIEKTGGIAAGMSGSPVYVDRRLVGAVSYGFSFTDHRVGFLTPIEKMLPVLDLARTQTGSSLARTPLLPEFQPVATPLMVSGMGERALRRLKALVEPLGYRVETGGRAGNGLGAGDAASGAAPAGPEALSPGSAFGASLVTGDLSVTAIGTVTYVEDGYFLGFGHPFLGKGPVEMPVSLAEIHETVASQEAPFKVGSPVRLVGTLTQDRPAGVAGQLGAAPPGIEVKVTVEDEDRHTTHGFRATVSRDEALAAGLLTTAALQGMDSGLERIGRGTADLRVSIAGANLPGGEVVRENTFFSPGDIGASALRDLVRGVQLLTTNPFREVDLKRVEITAKVSEQRRTGVVEKARLVKAGPLHAGEAVELEAWVRPYRGEPKRERITLNLPQDLRAGRYTITVHGGTVSLSAPEDEGAEEAPPVEGGGHVPNPEKPKAGPVKAQEPKTNAESFEALLDEYLKRERNNELVAELLNLGQDEEAGGGQAPEKRQLPARHPKVEAAAPPAEEQADRPSAKARLPLPYVVYGSAEVEIEVLGGGPIAPPLKPPPEPRWERPWRDP